MEHQCRSSLGGCHDALFLQESGPLESEAMVMGVLNQAFDVLVLRFGVQKRIYCNVSIPGMNGRPAPTGKTKPIFPPVSSSLLGKYSPGPEYPMIVSQV
jgi:hypothetical protein